jgi:hypothetical protein
MFAIVPSWTPLKSYSSKIGIGAAPSMKTLGLIVILEGSDRNLLQPKNIEQLKPHKRKKGKVLFFMVDFIPRK